MTKNAKKNERRPFIKRVLLKNYKSIAACDVDLHPLTFLVGPNGSGKSNFLDAFRFVSDSLRASLDHALRDRGGINQVRRRSGGHPTHFGMRFDFRLPASWGHYAFQIAARAEAAFEVQTEECVVHGIRSARFAVSGGEVRAMEGSGIRQGVAPPAAAKDRLYLVTASGLPEFRQAYDALSTMGFYNLSPARIRDLQAPDSGHILARDGANLTSVLRQLATREPERKRRIEEYLSKIVPGVHGVDVKILGPKETLEFGQDVLGAKDPWRFLAASMSDGTLRALGILVALFQPRTPSVPNVPLVGVEEPEMALHPAAVATLLDALREASLFTQVIVTTHSPDLLDSAHLGAELLLAVHAVRGATQIAEIDEASRDVVHQGLYTPGELLRLGQLQPNVRLFGERTKQLRLFGSGANGGESRQRS